MLQNTKRSSLAPGKYEWNFRHAIFKQILVIDGWGVFCEITLIPMSLDFTDDQSTLVQVMAWCLQATSHYLGLCWPRSLLPYGVTTPQWVTSWRPSDTYMCQQSRPSLVQIMTCHQAGAKPFDLYQCWNIFNWTLGNKLQWYANTLGTRQNSRHCPDDIFKCVSLNKNVWISNKISLNIVSNVPINNIPALV